MKYNIYRHLTEEMHQLGGTENRFLLKMMQKACALGVSSEVGGGVYTNPMSG